MLSILTLLGLVATSLAAPLEERGLSYKDTVVLHHNIHRANHSSPNVTWDLNLAATAQKIAKTCVFAHNMTVDGGGYGQNIAAGIQQSNISYIISDLFYNSEAPAFNGLYGQAQPSYANFGAWGHFSQVVWKSTTKVGCATYPCPGGLKNVGANVPKYFTVCNYKSPGKLGARFINANMDDADLIRRQLWRPVRRQHRKAVGQEDPALGLWSHSIMSCTMTPRSGFSVNAAARKGLLVVQIVVSFFPSDAVHIIEYRRLTIIDLAA